MEPDQEVGYGEYSRLAAGDDFESAEDMLDPTFEPLPVCCSPIPERVSPGEQHQLPYPIDQQYESSLRTSSSSRATSRVGHRSKKARKIRWLVLSQNGSRQVLHVDKRNIIQMYGLEIPMRDMRLLDTSTRLTYDTMGQILVRENALVFSVEYVRLIITADRVVIPLELEASEQATKFATILENMISYRAHMNKEGESQELPFTHSTLDTEHLPFELQVLEMALGEICRHLTSQVTNLELVAHPALEDLTKNSDTLNLERVRKIKTQHQRLLGRIKAAREMLERYLEDDDDMWRMCLTQKQEMETGSDKNLDAVILQRSAFAVRRSHSLSRTPPPFAVTAGRIAQLSQQHSLERDRDTSTDSSGFDLCEVENLLESYCMMLDDMVQKLVSLGEYIDDTEDYINIELDYNRNRLIKIEIIITTATFVLAFFSVVAGVLGENLRLPDSFAEDLSWFVTINLSTLALCFVCFIVMLLMLKANKLI